MDGLAALHGQQVQLLITIGDRKVTLQGVAQLEGAEQGARCLRVKVRDEANEYEIFIQEQTWNGVITPPARPGEAYTICLDAVSLASMRAAN
jgi:hypothetical protein